MSARRRSPKFPRTRSIKTDQERAAEMEYLREKAARQAALRDTRSIREEPKP